MLMKNTKVCILAGGIGPGEYLLLEKYAKNGCRIALMDKNKVIGQRVKQELESKYRVSVFFFHGDKESEEDRDLFLNAVQEMYGRTDYFICKND